MRRIHLLTFSHGLFAIPAHDARRSESSSQSYVPEQQQEQLPAIDQDKKYTALVKKLKYTRDTHVATNDRVLKKRIALQAWRDLQALPDDDLHELDAYQLAVLLSVWAHFSKFWEHGRNGPSNPLPPVNMDKADPDEIPIIDLGCKPGHERQQMPRKLKTEFSIPESARFHEPARRNILDETFE